MTAPDRVGGRHPAQTWPDCAVPTDAQLCDWIASFRPGDDPRVAADVLRFRLAEKAAAMRDVLRRLEDEQQARLHERVAAEKHVGMLARLVESMADDVTRYKLAWTSARRRASRRVSSER